MLTERDVKAVWDCAEGLGRSGSRQQVTADAVAGLQALIPGEHVGINDIDVAHHEMNVELVLPGGEHPGGVPPPPSVLTDHPMIEHYLNTRDPTPCRISDVTSRHRWLSSAVYAEFLRPLGTPHLLVIPVQMGQTGGFAYSIAKSGRDFTDRDRGVAMMFQAALVVHHRAVERRLADAAPAAKTVLTPREQQVMALIATGASAKAIGRLIGRSERTVHKHLENVYGKLGVGDRVTAVNILRSNGWL